MRRPSETTCDNHSAGRLSTAAVGLALMVKTTPTAQNALEPSILIANGWAEEGRVAS
jgi:hypothetical protein